MKYIKIHVKKPISGVDVHIVTESGYKSVAKYWHLTKQWLSADPELASYDKVAKWKYADAELTQK